MKEYTVIYERAGSNFSAYVPDLPGCIATGDTLEETKQIMREAMRLHLDLMRRDGDPIPEPSIFAENVPVAA